MKIERSQVTKLVITGAHRLDPITVFMEDIEPRKGKIVIECYGKSWSGYWGGMGDRTIAEFFCSCNCDYIARNISDAAADLTDADAIKDSARREIAILRRGRLLPATGFRIGRNDIDKEQARELWDRVEFAYFGDDGWGDSRLMEEIFGDEWWCHLPTKPNPDYQYLRRIIDAVQDGLKMVANEAKEPA